MGNLAKFLGLRPSTPSPTVTGDGGGNAALGNLIAGLSQKLGLIVDQTGGGGGIPEVQILGSLIGTGLVDTGTADATNLLVSTQQAFTGIDWFSFNVTMADSGALAPDSTSTASTLTETSAANQHNVSQGLYTAASAAQYTFAISLKQGLRTRAALTIVDPMTQANFATCIFDLAGGAIGVAASVGGTFTGASATITAKSNGFYLCTLTATTSGSGNYDVVVTADAGSGSGAANLSYAGNTSAPALTIWGAGVWAGTAGTYIPLNANAGAVATTVQQVFSPNGGTTAYWGSKTPNPWVGFDAGVPVQWTRYRFAPRPSAAAIEPIHIPRIGRPPSPARLSRRAYQTRHLVPQRLPTRSRHSLAFHTIPATG
jgi:hypothetical protein